MTDNRRTVLGQRGPEVELWQRALVRAGLLSSHDVDGIHGPKTEAASVTYERTTGGHPAPLTVAERARKWGAFAFVPAPTAADPQAIRITDGWAKDHIVSVHIPQLKAIVGAPSSCRIPWHKDGADDLQDLWREWDDAGLLGRILTFDGSWVPRLMRGSSAVLSSHAHGTAFDVNARWNFLGQVPAPIGARGCVRELVPIAESLGWAWLGWRDNPDGMHFEKR